MPRYEITAWDVAEKTPSQPAWRSVVEAPSIGDALTTGQTLYRDTFPDAPASQHEIHATGPHDRVVGLR